MKDFARDANSERIKNVLDNRIGVISAMALLSLHLSINMLTPKHEEDCASFSTLIKLILVALAVIVLGATQLKPKKNEH
jgi:predicted permease